MYRFLCGFWQNSQHFWHICKDQHIAHFDMLEWWDTQGQLDIHTVCNEYMGQGLAYILVDKSKLLCDSLLSRVHSLHIFPMDMGQHTLG